MEGLMDLTPVSTLFPGPLVTLCLSSGLPNGVANELENGVWSGRGNGVVNRKINGLMDRFVTGFKYGLGFGKQS